MLKFSVWQNLSPQAVITLACHLYNEIGGAALDSVAPTEIWDNGLPVAQTAVYTREHGYTLGVPHDGLLVKMTENWTRRQTADELVATGVHIRSLGERRCEVQYRLGQLSCTLPPGGATEERFGQIVSQVAARDRGNKE